MLQLLKVNCSQGYVLFSLRLPYGMTAQKAWRLPYTSDAAYTDVASPGENWPATYALTGECLLARVRSACRIRIIPCLLFHSKPEKRWFVTWRRRIFFYLLYMSGSMSVHVTTWWHSWNLNPRSPSWRLPWLTTVPALWNLPKSYLASWRDTRISTGWS